MFEVVDRYCFYSKNVYNEANYILRQEFVKNNRILGAYDIQKLMQNMDCYKECGSIATILSEFFGISGTSISYTISIT